MIPLLMKLLSTVVGLIEEHPEVAKSLLAHALELLRHSQTTPTGSTGANILRNQLAAQAGLQAGLSAAVASAATAVQEKQKAAERATEAERERQHDFDHGVGVDEPIPFTVPGQSP